MKAGLSTVIITKNEEKNIERCLKSVSFSDEIIIVDSGSTDSTLDIAERYGCRIFIEEWKGYGKQKQSAVDKASNRWVLSIDADEFIPDETKMEIENILKNPDADAYSFPRKNIFHNKWIKGCGWWPDRVVRLFDKTKGRFSESIVHESWQTTGIVKKLKNPIIHYSYKDYHDLIERMNKYTTLAADEIIAKEKDTSVLKALLSSMWMFFRSYFIQKGFMYGSDGLVICTNIALNTLFKYLKAKEKKELARTKPE